MLARIASMSILIAFAAAAGADDQCDFPGTPPAIDVGRGAPTELSGLTASAPAIAATPARVAGPTHVANLVVGAVSDIRISVMTEAGRLTSAAATAARRVVCSLTVC